MAGYDIGVGVPTGLSSGEGASPLSKEVGGDTAVGLDSLSFSGAPQHSTGVDYDLFGGGVPSGLPLGDGVEPEGAEVPGYNPPVNLVQAPGNPPPPPTGIPFDVGEGSVTGFPQGDYFAYDPADCRMEPSGLVSAVVTVVAAGAFKPALPSFDEPFDMFGGEAYGTPTGEFPEPTVLDPKGATDPGAIPSPGLGQIPVPDSIPPDLPVYGTIQGFQVNGDPLGRTSVVINWVEPLVSQEVSGEYQEDATGAPQDITVANIPVVSGSYDVFEVTGYSAVGGATLLSDPISPGAFKLPVLSSFGFTVDSWVQVIEGSLREYGQIFAIEGDTLILYNPLTVGAFTAAASVRNVDILLKVETTDYTVDLPSGVFSLLAGQFTASNPVFFRYKQEITDLDVYELYRIPGQTPYPDGVHHDDILGDGGVVVVDDSISNSLTQFVDVLDSPENGKSWTYYLFAKDTKGNISRGQSMYIETLVSRVQNLQATVGDTKVVLTWDALVDPNVDGVNVYRSPGAVFDPSTAERVNSSLLTGTSFEDGPENAIDRRPPGEVAYPVSGQQYSYSVEAEDTVTDWDTGTQNESLDPLKAEVTSASKTD